MRRGLFWFLAVVITLGSAVFQRMTGPTHALGAKTEVAGTLVRASLPRSAETSDDAELAVPAPAPVEGRLEWKRFKTADAWTSAALV
ncbi:MAG: hypothetical protein ACXWFJ_08725, partial [Candidatus Aminicenantales bacterium]